MNNPLHAGYFFLFYFDPEPKANIYYLKYIERTDKFAQYKMSVLSKDLQ